MIYDNDHTDAEIARREHAAEMGESSSSEKRWLRFVHKVECALKLYDFSDGNLDKDEADECYSLDGAGDAFDNGMSVVGYLSQIISRRQARGLPVD
jgi:hypothetical protein